MQTFSIAFNFIAQSPSAEMSASLQLTDSSSFFVTDNKNIQIKSPYAGTSTPPLNFLSLYDNNLQFETGYIAGQPQYLQFILPLQSSASSLKGNLPAHSSGLQVSYQFIGSDQRGNINVGDFDIPFPG